MVQNSNRYKAAGVDIDAGHALVQAIQPFAKATQRPGTNAELGGFAAGFDPKAAGFEDPILFSATDGVGTKLKIAIETNQNDHVGIDLVAMCVNDLVVNGAQPLFFLDYFATGALSVPVASAVVRGIAAGCQQAGCALVGGETAELPGLYQGDDYDLAGFAVGAAERAWLSQPRAVEVGDVLVGLSASGLHSNGFSLVRAIVEEHSLDYAGDAPFAPDHTLAGALLTPTRIYVNAVLAAYHADLAKAFAHITGGGLVDNIPRMLPDGCGARLYTHSWQAPPVFAWLQDLGALTPATMHRTFNCGLGMVAAVARERVDRTMKLFRDHGETANMVGEVTATPGVHII